jgi:hypothetical protein
MQSITKNGPLIDLNIGYDNKLTSNISKLKVPGIVINNTHSWKSHVDVIIPKLSAACFAVRVVEPPMLQEP